MVDDSNDHEAYTLHELLRKRKVRWRKGWRALLNHLEAIEMTKGTRFILRKRRRYTTYRVTMAAIREHAPGLLPPEERPAKPALNLELRTMETFLADLEEKQRDVCLRFFDAEVGPIIQNLEERVERIEQK